MAVNDGFEIAAKVAVQSHCRAMFSCKTERLGEFSQRALNGNTENHGGREIFDNDDFLSCARAGQQPREITSLLPPPGCGSQPC